MPMKHILKMALERKGGRRLRRPPRMLYPAPAERAYRRDLLKIVEDLAHWVNTLLVPRLPQMQTHYSAGLPSAKKDSDDLIDESFQSIELAWTRNYTPDELRALARRSGIAVSEWNRRQMQKQIGAVLDIDVFSEEPWLEKVMANYARENVELITSVKTRYFREIRETVMGGFQDGTPWEDIAQEIQDRTGVSESRAELIARDQIGKLQGQLTEERQTELGIQKYIWRTSQDERVRESHAKLEGTEHAWDDPPMVDGERANPGEPIQCRCYAEPVLDSVES